jgi:hypothetical protein
MALTQEQREILEDLKARRAARNERRTPVALQSTPQNEVGGLEGFARGFTKGAISTLSGMSRLGNTIFDKTAGQIKIKGHKLADLNPERHELLDRIDEFAEPVGKAERAGKFVEQVAEFAIPSSKVSRLGKGANIFRRVGAQAATDATVAGIQSGGDLKETGTAAGVSIALPVAGRVTRLL